ncbi:MAG TPA: hypothetical protein VGQ83_38440 [Polyangia bacterium]|jgi:hypothetical protein
MPDRPHRTAAAAAAGVIALALGAGCFAHLEAAEPRPLSPAELAVQVLPGAQEVSIRLAQTCRPVGLIERFQSEYDIRVRTVQLGGNIAQVINNVSYSSTTNNYTVRFAATDLRFWACPPPADAPPPPLPPLPPPPPPAP